MEIIHIVLGKANPDRMNGINKVVFQLATRQAQMGNEVSLWGIAENLDENYGERSFKTHLFLQQSSPFKVDPKLTEAIKSYKNKNAIFHIHGGWVPVFSNVSKILKKYKIPFVFTPHGAYNVIAMKRSYWKKKVFFYLYEKKLLSNASIIHCIGSSEVDGLNSIYKTSKTKLLPYGFDFKTIQQVGNSTSKFIIGFVGRLDIYTKGLDLLVEAFEEFYAHHTNSELWIVGDSEEKVKLAEVIKAKNLAASVKLLGSKFGEEKNSIIASMSVFTHPSRNEGLPAAVLEASSFGVPCVVSKATNVGEYILNNNAGWVIQNENVNELIDALEKAYKLWENSQFSTMQSNASNMVITEFSWENLIPKYTQLYQQISN
ncbi:MAG: glycosyltransferase family 4 protein [Cytophagales bacterium]